MVKDQKNKTLKAFFYCTEGGSEPVPDVLMKLDREDRRTVGTDVKDVEFSWPIGLPLCRKVSSFWEVRSSLQNGRIFRVLFQVDGQNMVLLHGFIKKSQKTPKKEINTAETRWKDYGKRK